MINVVADHISRLCYVFKVDVESVLIQYANVFLETGQLLLLFLLIKENLKEVLQTKHHHLTNGQGQETNLLSWHYIIQTVSPGEAPHRHLFFNLGEHHI
jgi:hypothetical protein